MLTKARYYTHRRDATVFKEALRQFFQSEKPPEIDHSVFGRISALRMKDGALFWETEDRVDPVLGPLDLFFDAPPSGPRDEQVAFYRWFCTNYAKLKEDFRQQLAAAFNRFNDSEPDNVFHVLTLSGLGLPADGKQTSPWDVSFEAEDKMLYTVYFEDGVVTNVSVDG